MGRVEVPPNAILTVEVEQLDGANGKPLFSTRVFSDQDAERLDKLKIEHGLVVARSSPPNIAKSQITHQLQ